MKSETKGGEWFLAIGILLLFTGLVLWTILPGAVVPPLLLPGFFSALYGGYCIWTRGKMRSANGSAEAGGEGTGREMLMMVRRRKIRARR